MRQHVLQAVYDTKKSWIIKKADVYATKTIPKDISPKTWDIHDPSVSKGF